MKDRSLDIKDKDDESWSRMTTAIDRSGQMTAIADLRWRLFVNRLRSKRGKMELASRLLITLVFAVGGLGGFIAATGFFWYFVSKNNAEYLAILLWPVFFFWQLFPVMSTAFTNNPDSADLLRFSPDLPFIFFYSSRLWFFRSRQRARYCWLAGNSAGYHGRTPWVISLGADSPSDLRTFQPCPDADGLRVAGALAGAAPHPRNHGRAFHSGHAQLSTDRPSDGTPRQSAAP